MIISIQAEELRQRQAKVVDFMNREGLKAFFHFNPVAVFYLTGFSFIATERPAALVQLADGSNLVFIPRLELEHCREAEAVDRVEAYPEYPGLVHPLIALGRLALDLGLGGAAVGADAGGYGARFGYTGPGLSEVIDGAEVKLFPNLINETKQIKSAAEIELIREAARWGDRSHRLLQDGVRAGATETEVSINASREASVEMMTALGPDYDPKAWVALGAVAGFRGQVGPNSANPHAMLKNIALRPGDVLVTYAKGVVWGYSSEMERTMFVGQPDRDQTVFFNHMTAVREIALETIKPGRKCAEVDQAVWDYYDRNDLLDYWRHHTGHCLGLEIHEAPFLDRGDDRIIQPGMVFSIEPGLYVPGLGGFRHSDTVAVTETGIDMLTDYPVDLADCICPI